MIFWLRNLLVQEEEKERIRKMEEEVQKKQREEEDEKRRTEEQRTMTLKRRQFEVERQAMLAEEAAKLHASEPPLPPQPKAAVGVAAPCRSSVSTSVDAIKSVTSGTQTAELE